MTQELTPDIAAEGRERTASDSAAAPSSGALVVVLVGTFITVLDFFIANVAVPAIKADLHATAAQAQMIVVGYGVAFTSGLITGGRLGDLYGRRRLFALGMTLFMVASAACSFAPNVTVLVVARILQGAPPR